jgi:drug/metabolite transporter (DMT)-like permease
MNISNHFKGVLLASMGMLVISPDSLLIRFADIDLWPLMFMRGLFIALTLFLVIMLMRSTRAGLRQIVNFDGPTWLMVVLLAVSSFFFVASVQHTSVAHTLIIVGAAPVFSAILGILLLQERVPLNTWITIMIVFCGLVFVVYDRQQSSLIGDFYAFLTGMSWALILIMARKTRSNNMLIIIMLSGLVMAALPLPMVSFENISLHQVMIASMVGVINGIALSFLTMAPRYIPAAEVAVFMPLESVFGSFLVWWFLAEYPGHVSITAGGIIIFTLMINSYYQIKKGNRMEAAEIPYVIVAEKTGGNYD